VWMWPQDDGEVIFLPSPPHQMENLEKSKSLRASGELRETDVPRSFFRTPLHTGGLEDIRASRAVSGALRLSRRPPEKPTWPRKL